MTGYHSANFGLPRPFCSGVKSRHATDRQTDGRTDGQTDTTAQSIIPYGGGGIIKVFLFAYRSQISLASRSYRIVPVLSIVGDVDYTCCLESFQCLCYRYYFTTCVALHWEPVFGKRFCHLERAFKDI